MKPLISVCLLTYCHEKYIIDCLNGILNQTYKNIELLIYDDFSKDNTRKLINEFMTENKERFTHVELIFPEYNSGNIARNCNEMIKKAKGKYIKLFSGDDIMTYKCLELLEGTLTNNPHAALVYSNGHIVKDDFRIGDRTSTDSFFKSHKSPNQSLQFYKLLNQNFIPAPTVLIKREVYKVYGLHNEKFAFEDYEYWVRISRGETFVYLNEKTVFYRRAENSMTNIKDKFSEKKILKIMIEEGKVIRKYMKFLGKNQKDEVIGKYYQKYIEIAKNNKLFHLKYSLLFKVKIREKFPRHSKFLL